MPLAPDTSHVSLLLSACTITVLSILPVVFEHVRLFILKIKCLLDLIKNVFRSVKTRIGNSSIHQHLKLPCALTIIVILVIRTPN